jgi:hypothetical protein
MHSVMSSALMTYDLGQDSHFFVVTLNLGILSGHRVHVLFSELKIGLLFGQERHSFFVKLYKGFV